MNVIDNIINFLGKPEEESNDQAPEGLCPVCWGHQQYEGKIRDLIDDRQIDVNNHKDNYTLIQNFLVEHINGIKLREGDTGSCPACTGETEYET